VSAQGTGRRHRRRHYGVPVKVFALGLALGLAAGTSPGPLLALVITQTLRSGLWAGIVTAAAPLVSDVVVVPATLLVLQHLPGRTLSVLGVAGGIYVVRTGVAAWREAGEVGGPSAQDDVALTGPALRRAVTVNLLSPHPWLSWATALGPLTVRTWQGSPWTAAALVIGFYLTLVGAKVVLAVLVAGGRGRLSPTGLRRALRCGAALLVIAGLALATEFAPQALGA
jgi:threonine/homoserine/homoserine lactone efflux protein